MKKGALLWFAVLTVIFAGLLGCQPHQLIRKQVESCPVKMPAQADDRCKHFSIEQFADGEAATQRKYALAFVEFDDQGMAWEPAQMEALLSYLKRRHREGTGTVVMVFVHGWKHNAEFCDSNVACFREMVRTAAHADPLRREVVGVYVGWHGRTLNALGNLSFFNRKGAAERVAQGQVRELFSRLLALQSEANNGSGNSHRMRLMFMGHSFGGLIAYKALAPYLLDGVLREQGKAESKRFADLVLLLNPAFEANHYYPLHLAAQLKAGERKTDERPRPVFVSITSENDEATKKAFPIGLSIGTALQSFKDGAERQRTHHTIGHWDEFKTHSLKAIPAAGEAKPQQRVNGDSCGCEAWRLRTENIDANALYSRPLGDRSREYGSNVLTPLKDSVSATHWVVHTEPPVIDGHNDFMTDHIRDFIFVLYNDIVSY